ncbi:MAG TPA: DUF192 domain-containing protein [Thermoanaerobaculia bacterium]
MATKAAVVLLLGMMACAKTPAPPPSTTTTSSPQETATAAPADTAGSAASSGPRVLFPDGHVVRVEVAIDDATRAQGLMYRDQVRPGTGMLFIFPEDGEYGFWMKNTLIPLDIIWIDKQNRVTHVKYDVPPCQADPCPSYPPNAISRYVLEVGAGVARAHGIKAGDVLRFEDIGNVGAR